LQKIRFLVAFLSWVTHGVGRSHRKRNFPATPDSYLTAIL